MNPSKYKNSLDLRDEIEKLEDDREYWRSLARARFSEIKMLREGLVTLEKKLHEIKIILDD